MFPRCSKNRYPCHSRARARLLMKEKDLGIQYADCRDFNSQRGAVLIYIVAVILIAGVLGLGIVSMTTTSTFTGLSYNPSDQARFLAKAGVEYTRHSGFELAEGKSVYVVDEAQGKEFEITQNNGSGGVELISTVYKDTFLESRFRITFFPEVYGNALVTRGDMQLTGSSQIIGNVQVDGGHAELDWSVFVDGDLRLGRNAAYTIPNEESVAGEIIEDVIPYEFCEFERNPWDVPGGCDNFTITNGIHRIDLTETPPAAHCYHEFEAGGSGRAEVQITDGDHVLYVDDFTVSGAGTFEIIGDGRLIVFVDNSFGLLGSGEINQAGTPEQLVFYYAGEDNDIEIGDNVRFRGGFYSPEAEIVLSGSSEFDGYIEADSFSGSGNIRLYSNYFSWFEDDGYCDTFSMAYLQAGEEGWYENGEIGDFPLSRENHNIRFHGAIDQRGGRDLELTARNIFFEYPLDMRGGVTLYIEVQENLIFGDSLDFRGNAEIIVSAINELYPVYIYFLSVEAYNAVSITDDDAYEEVINAEYVLLQVNDQISIK